MAHCVLYADDTTISSSDGCINTVTDKLNAVLCSVSKWCHENHLHINPNKSKFLVFRSTWCKLTYTPGIIIDSHLINISDNVTFLGILLDANLTFAYHIVHIKK